jgi:hypothetical protein
MTNPNNAIGTNGAFSGRTSPNALNDILGAFSKGVVSGWTCSPKSGMTVQLGGSANVRDVALAEDNAGNKLTIDNRSGAPVEVTLNGAPSTNNRIDAIVAYVDNPSTGDNTTTDNPTACGIIAVSGTIAANPTAPSDAQIRSAITIDGATGGVAYYVVLATILVGTNVTTIGSGVITQGAASTTENITDGSITTAKLANSAVTSAKIDWTTMGYVQSSVNTVMAPSTSFSDRLSLTIPATGKYKCDLHCYFQCVELRQNKYGQARILVNGTVPTQEGTFVFEAFVPGSVDSYAIGSASSSMTLNLTQGDTVKLQVKVGSGYSDKFVNTWADLSLLRVG